MLTSQGCGDPVNESVHVKNLEYLALNKITVHSFIEECSLRSCPGNQRGKSGGINKGGGINKEVGTSIYTLLYKIDSQQGPLYSTGNYTRYFIIIREMNLKKNTYIHTHAHTLNHFSVHLKLTQYCKSIILK